MRLGECVLICVPVHLTACCGKINRGSCPAFVTVPLFLFSNSFFVVDLNVYVVKFRRGSYK